MTVVVPALSSTTRWRCAQCGNLTRFDVVRSTRVREFVHLDLAGAPRVEETEVLDERIEQVRCRWCAGTDSIEVVPRLDGASGPAVEGT
jgi:transposase